MRLYVVLRRLAEGERPVAAFSSRERALLFVDERALDARVLEVTVRGEYGFPAKVHAVPSAGPAPEGPSTIDLFADAGAARDAAGTSGAVHELTPDATSVENVH